MGLIRFLLLCVIRDVVCMKSYNVRIAMMLPHDDTYLKPLIGYETSASAVTIALDRVRDEQILPGANFSFLIRNCKCLEEVATGHLVEILEKNLADVVISSPCAPPAFISAVLCSKYNVPLLNWAVTTAEMADGNRFRTVSRTIGSASRIGKALAEYLNYFSWRRVALLFTDDGLARKCHSIAQGTITYLPRMGIQNAFSLIVEGDEPSDMEIDKFLDGMKAMARVAIICVDNGIRRVMLKAQERGMTTEDYLYILPEYVQNENRSDVWTNFNSQDGRNTEAKAAFNASVFVEMQLSTGEDLHYFKKRIAEKMRLAPFYYTAQKQDEFYGSMYSPFLHDSVYLYALALNKTLAKGGNISDGRSIIEHSKGIRFQGASGYMVTDEWGSRDPTFVVKALDKNRRLWPVAKLESHRLDGDQMQLLVSESMMWESRDGYRPTGEPRCGWLNDKCAGEAGSSKQSIFQFKFAHWIALAVVGSVVFIVVGVVLSIYFVKKKLLANEMSQMLWRVSYKDLIQIKDLHQRSHASFNTVNSAISEETAEVMLKGLETVAHYRSALVWMRVHSGSVVLSSDRDHLELKMLRDINHENLNPFVGLCIDSSKPISLWSYCGKGSLEDCLQNNTIKLDWFFKYSLIKDLAAGLEYLHNTGFGSHGHLKSSNCLVDARWMLKITDYGLASLRVHNVSVKDSSRSLSWRDPRLIPVFCPDKLWIAPEQLRISHPASQGTQKGDIYSFAIILSEIISRDKPYGMFEDMTPEEIVAKVRRGGNPVLRPLLRNERDADVDAHMVSLMNDCWVEEPERRPEMKEIRGAIKQMGRGKNTNLMDHVLKMMETYAKNLENQVNDRTRQLSEEMQKSDVLLYRMLPQIMAERLKRGQMVEPEAYDNATIFFSDIPSFGSIAQRCSPFQLITFLNELCTMFDSIIEGYDVFKVETINDQYLVVSGLPNRNGNKHASEIADMALHLQLSIGSFFVSSMPKEKFELRCGIHTGPVVAGVVGLTMPRYCMFGDTVNVASRIETNGKPSCIHISDETHKYLTQVIGGYLTKSRGEIILKGKGVMYTYWLLGKKIRSIQDKTDEMNAIQQNPEKADSPLYG